MSDVMRKVWNFILLCIPVWGLSILVMELLTGIPVLSLERFFFLCYFAAFFLAALLLRAWGRESLTWKLLPALPVAVLAILRDLVLFANAAAALLLFAGFLILRESPIWKWALTGATVLLLCLWIPKDGMPKYAAVFLILLCGITFSELRNRQSMYWTILLSVVLGITLAIPSSEEPMRWEGLRSAFSRIENYFVTKYKDIAYFFSGLFDADGTAYAGYSEVGRLGGGVSDSDWEAMLLDTNGKDHPVYLRGAEFAKLGQEGFSERVTDDLPVNSWLAEYLSALANSEMTKAEVYCFSQLEQASAEYRYIRTSDLLIPSTVYRVDKGLEYGLSEQKKKGFTYDFNFIALDQASPYYVSFAKATEQQDPVHASYEDAVAAAREYYGIRLSDYMSEEQYEKCLAAYDAMAEAPEYLDTSMGTERIRELARTITEGCETDLEKAERIEAYLRQYKYDTSVDLRGNENYVDAFLFEVERGYCVHFASAMVLLLRESGVPARFVQGFLYHPDEDGVILEKHAHAWVEAYLPGLGWVTFEPTSVMPAASETGWGREITDSGAGAPGQSGQPEPVQPPIVTPPVPVTPQEGTAEGKRSFWMILRTVGFYLLAVVAFAALLLTISLLIRRIRYKKLTPEGRLKADVNTICKSLDRELPEGTTAESVFEYLPYVKSEATRQRLESLFRAYYRVRFRGDAADPGLSEQAKGIIADIRKERRRNQRSQGVAKDPMTE
ncbi:MAG: transglutaminase domain-containing protein [Eubacterium sp.]|nr:transglutaminase domain-containing protein [Eubacterium sp.]